MDKNKITNILIRIKEQFLNNPLFSRSIPVVLSVLILSLTGYYCFNIPWLSLFSVETDTKQLITEAFKFHWIPVFLSRLPYLFYALILNFIALLMGNRILRWLKVDFDSNIDKIVFSIPLGWSIYSIGIFYLGVSGLLYVEAVYCFLTLLGVLSILEIRKIYNITSPQSPPSQGGDKGEVTNNINSLSKFKLDKTDLIFLPVIIIFLVVQLVTSFSPVWVNDVLFYHMALPELYVKHHSLVHVPGFLCSTYPAHTEMLYLLGLIISGETLSKLFSFSISLMFLLSIFSFGNRYSSKVAGYLAAITLPLISPFFSGIFSEPMTDVALGLFSLLGIYAFFMWIEDLSSNEVKERREGYLYLSIICCALAAVTKIQGVFFVLLVFVGFLVTVKMDRYFLKKLAWCVLVVGIIALPWYIRSWWLTGDPLFPFFYNYLGGRYWSEYSNARFWEQHSSAGAGIGGVKSFSDFIMLTKYFFIRPLSPLILIFGIPALIMLRRNKLIIYLLFITLVYFIFFVFTGSQGRYFYVGVAMMGIVVGHFFKTVWTRYLLTRIPIILSIVVFSVASFFGSIKWIEGPFFAGLGVLDQGQLYTHISQKQLDIDIDHYYSASVWVNENLPQDSKILTWHVYGYHLEREYVRVNPMYQGVLDFGRINDASTFLKSIKELGITHLMYQSNGALLPRRTKEFLNKCMSELLDGGKITKLKQIGPFVIYSVMASPGV